MQTIYDAKILIVDDNQDLLNLVTTALRSTGYNQLTACTGCAAAQAAFAANRPDLMILDINLPDGDGFTLFRTLHSMSAFCSAAIGANCGGLPQKRSSWASAQCIWPMLWSACRMAPPSP